jgi:hypothetical protein
MKKAVVLLRERFELSEKYRVELEVLEIEPSKKHPEGIR